MTELRGAARGQAPHETPRSDQGALRMREAEEFHWERSCSHTRGRTPLGTLSMAVSGHLLLSQGDFQLPRDFIGTHKLRTCFRHKWHNNVLETNSSPAERRVLFTAFKTRVGVGAAGHVASAACSSLGQNDSRPVPVNRPRAVVSSLSTVAGEAVVLCGSVSKLNVSTVLRHFVLEYIF